MEENKLNLLKESLSTYKNKWKDYREELDNNEDKVQIAKYTAMMYLAQWIINSINGGLDKPHATNICKILLGKEEV
jgi:hypothetical protein